MFSSNLSLAKGLPGGMGMEGWEAGAAVADADEESGEELFEPQPPA
jgi:hypothetical protein